MRKKLLCAALALGVFAPVAGMAETVPVIKTNLWVDRYWGTGPDPVTLDGAREICKGSLWDGLYFSGDDVIRCDWTNHYIYWERFVKCPDSSWTMNYNRTACTRPDQPSGAEFVNAGQASCEQLVGNPINAGVGSKLEQQTDLVFPGIPDLTFVRTFNSRYLPVSPVFPWATNFHISAKETIKDGQRTLEFHRGDGKVFFYTFAGQNWRSAAAPQVTVTEELDNQGVTAGWLYVDANSGETEHYDAQGQLLALTRLNGQKLQFTYSDGTVDGGPALGNDGQPTHMALEAGLLTRVNDALGHTLDFGYNILGRLYSVRGPNKQQVNYRYDGAGNLNQVGYADGSTRRYLYEHTTFKAALTGIIDETGQRSLTVNYDAQNRAISTEHTGGVNKYQITYLPDGGAKVFDPLGTARTYGFGNYNGAIKTTDLNQPCPNGCGFSGKHTSYDANGNLTRLVDWNGTATEYAYDTARGLELRRSEGLKDEAGVSVVQPETRTIVTSWHASLPLPLNISEYSGGVNASGQPSGSLQKQTVYTYDSQGNPLSRIEKSGADSRQWQRQYTSLGRVTSVTNPDGSNVQYSYYADDDSDLGKRGQLKQTSNSAGHVTQITDYSADGQPMRIIDPNGKISKLAYDARGRISSRQNGGQQLDYSYDAAGRISRVQGNDGTRLDYAYDSAGRLISVSDQKGNRVDYTLDNLGNRTGETTSGPYGEQLKQIVRQYNQLNQIQQLTGNE